MVGAGGGGKSIGKASRRFHGCQAGQPQLHCTHPVAVAAAAAAPAVAATAAAVAAAAVAAAAARGALAGQVAKAATAGF